jgi:DNA-binding MarR family transcriptional regulator
VNAGHGGDQASELSPQRLLELLYRRDLALAHHRHALARTLGVTETEVLALIHLVHRGELAPSDLAELLDLSSAGATALAQRLVAGGRVTRRPHPADRRSIVLRATPATTRALADADAPLALALDALTAGLRDDERATVAAVLGAVADIYEALHTDERGERAQATSRLERPVPSLWA